MESSSGKAGDILRTLENTLWLSCKSQLSRVIEELELLNKTNFDIEINDSIRFIKFLNTECSGNNFTTDKQWNELLNLMQINRKLNHRTLKFKDLLKNKHQICAAEGFIKQLNESAELSKTIDVSLLELDRLLQACSISLPPSKKDSPRSINKLFLMDELTSSENYLRDQCQPLLFMLKFELDNELIRKSPNLQTWKEKIEHYELVISRLRKFLQLMKEFELELIQVRPLICNNAQFNDNLALQEHKISTTVEICRQKFYINLEFHHELIETLYQQSKKGSNLSKNIGHNLELQLSKLLNFRNELNRRDLYDLRLTKGCQELHECRSLLDELMQNLRQEFGRFYFVNDRELLTIISLDSLLVSEKSAENRRLLCKLFNNSIGSFLVDDNNQLIEVRSPQEEVICLREDPVIIKRRINLYSVEIVRILNDVTKKLRLALKSKLIKHLNRPVEDRENFSQLPIQLTIVAEHVRFCQAVESAIIGGTLDELIEIYELQLKRFSIGDVSGKCRTETTERFVIDSRNWLEKFKESALISLRVHFITLLIKLRDHKVSKLTDWYWQKQVRYYFNNYELEVQIGSAKFQYKYDYLPLQTSDNFGLLPNYKRLISTKTSERCFLVASTAVAEFKLGANPYGPAGSGKTETIKALGHLLGCQVIVHNCDESNEIESLERLVWGLAHTGFWGCFDEFNRLSSSALSSVSLSLELVQASIRANKINAELPDGSLKRVDLKTAFFVTLNPGGPENSTYRGRRKLPANLRQLFMPISMMHVEIVSIVSELLMTLSSQQQFFASAQLKAIESLELGRKLYTWMEWMALNLGAINTCVWDLRFVMSILKRLKILMNLSEYQQYLVGDLNSLNQLLALSIELELGPRLSKCQLELLNSSLQRAFFSSNDLLDSNLKRKNLNDKITSVSIYKKIREAANFQKLNANLLDSVVKAAMNLNFQLETHTGVLLLGPPGAGKSSTWRLLSSVKSHSIKWIPLNPKACEKGLLFGHFDAKTKNWTDGLFTARVREALDCLQDDPTLQQVWLVLDGPIDSDWIESLNSVLDDNQVLTLGSGERLNFLLAESNQSIKLIFEAADIRFASPATISRLGLVFLEYSFLERAAPVIVCIGNSAEAESFNHNNHQIEDNFSQTTMVDFGKPIDILHNHDPLLESALVKLKAALDQRNLKSTSVADSTNICAIAGGSSTMRVKFAEKICSALSHSFVEYSCSRVSDASDLLYFLSRMRKGSSNPVLILNNIHLIKPEDCWQVRSFCELLRYIITYRIFYDSKLVVNQVDFCIIITADSFDQLDERILSSLNIKFEVQPTEELEGNVEYQDVERIFVPFTMNITNMLIEKISSTIKQPVVTFSNSSFGSVRRDKILALIGSSMTVHSFQNRQATQQSLAFFEELTSDEISGSNLINSQKHLFILNALELRLMDDKEQFRLFRYLNHLASSQKGRFINKFAKFIFIAHEIYANKEAATIWSSLGPVYHYDVKESTELEDRENFLRYYTSNISGIQGIQAACLSLADKTVNFFHFEIKNFTDNLPDERTVQEYLKLVVNLINGGTAKLFDERKALLAGLENLGIFEKNVNSIKLRCIHEEEKLTSKKSEIELLIKEIDEALQDSQKQRIHVIQLKSQQDLKSKEILQSSVKVEQELAEVEQSVESSRADIRQHLKPEALNEIRTLRSPPQTIKDILDVLFVLLGAYKDDDILSWQSLKSNLSKSSLKEELTNFDPRTRLTDSLLLRVNKLILEKSASFTQQQAAKASKAILPILGWIWATLDYGKVLAKLRPLQTELTRLEGEAARLAEKTAEIERELVEIDGKIAKGKEKLKLLQKEYDESQKNLIDIKQELKQSKSILTNLDGQVNRWRAKLASIEAILDNDELFKLSLTTASICLFRIEFSELQRIIQFFGNARQLRTEEFLEKLMISFINSSNSLIRSNENESNSNLSRLYQLIIMRILTDVGGMPIIPFVDLGSAEDSWNLAEQQLVEVLSFKEILCRQKEVVVWRPNEQQLPLMNWIQSIGLSVRLNKMVVLNLLDSDRSIDLDVLDQVQSVCSSLHTSSNVADRGRRGIILVGKLNEHPDLHHTVRPVNLLTSCNSYEKILSTIQSRIIHSIEPELSSSIKQLKWKLQMHYENIRKLDLKLLNKLAQVKEADGSMKNKDLVNVLSELHEASILIQADLTNLNAKLEELQIKQAKYSKFSIEASQFYSKYLANLGKLNYFYHFSLENYTRLLLSSAVRSDPVLVENNLLTTTDYHLIIEKTVRPMRPKDEAAFIKSLMKHSNQQVAMALNELTELRQAETGIKRATLELLAELNAAGKGTRRLMIVLHDPTKSSPQLEVDEMFQSKGKFATCSYSKLYVSGDSNERLESLITKTITAKHSTKRHGMLSGDATINCLCLANAHLATSWINRRLVKLLLDLEPLEAKILLILIGESSTIDSNLSKSIEKNLESQFDQVLLEHVQVKYWYDELTLDLPSRYRLFNRLIADKLSRIEEVHKAVKQQLTTGGSSSNNAIKMLSRQLILFHIVCQELAREEGPLKGGWKRNYTFDYDQLCLAFESLLKISKQEAIQQDEEGSDTVCSIRELLCNHVKSIHYGARMEDTVDEQSLDRLIELFLCPSGPELVNKLLEKVEILEIALNNRNFAEYDRLLSDLIGRSMSPQEEL